MHIHQYHILYIFIYDIRTYIYICVCVLIISYNVCILYNMYCNDLNCGCMYNTYIYRLVNGPRLRKAQTLCASCCRALPQRSECRSEDSDRMAHAPHLTLKSSDFHIFSSLKCILYNYLYVLSDPILFSHIGPYILCVLCVPTRYIFLYDYNICIYV